MMHNKKFWNDYKLVILACLSIGLAPFYPEPHIWGKIKWMAGGAHGMQLIDWWDVTLHGIPWILFLRLIIISIFKKISTIE